MSTNRCRFLPQIFFSAVVAAFIASNRTGFDRLTIQNGRARFGFSSHLHTQLLPQGCIDLFPNPRSLPLAEIPIGRKPSGQIMRQQTPRTATAQHIQNRVDNFPPVNGLRASCPSWPPGSTVQAVPILHLSHLMDMASVQARLSPWNCSFQSSYLAGFSPSFFLSAAFRLSTHVLIPICIQ